MQHFIRKMWKIIEFLSLFQIANGLFLPLSRIWQDYVYLVSLSISPYLVSTNSCSGLKKKKSLQFYSAIFCHKSLTCDYLRYLQRSRWSEWKQCHSFSTCHTRNLTLPFDNFCLQNQNFLIFLSWHFIWCHTSN